MKKIKLLLSFLSLCCYTASLNAQTETTLSFMDDLYQSTYYSPFNKSENKVSIGLPGLSSIYFNAVNSGFAMADFYPKGVNQAINPEDVLTKLKKKEFVSSRAQIDLFHFFYQKGSNAFSFNVTENFNAHLSYATDAAKLAWKGNDQFVGGQIDLSSFGLNMQHYREYALGYYKTKDKWQFGGKAKMLFGMALINTNKTDLKINVSDEIYQHTADGSFEVNTAGYDFESLSDNATGNVMKYLTNTKNKGLALDLGASYQYNKKLQFNSALTNLGYIKWKENAQTMTYNQTVAYAGIDLFQVLYRNGIDSLDKSFEQYFNEQFPDSAKIDSSQKSFTTRIPVNFSVGARYEIYTNTYAVARINLMGYRGLRTALTLGVYHDFFRWLNVGITNTASGTAILNPGLGLVLKGGPIQFYVVTDNLLAARFMRTQNINARFGINLVFGKIKEQEKISSVIE